MGCLRYVLVRRAQCPILNYGILQCTQELWNAKTSYPGDDVHLLAGGASERGAARSDFARRHCIRLVQGDQFWLFREAAAIGAQLLSNGAPCIGNVAGCAVDQMEQNGAALDVA